MSNTTADTVRYELMVIISPEIGETAINNRLEAIKKSLTAAGGEIFFEDIWGLRQLAYSIKKQDQGYYVVLDVNLDPKQLKELDRMLRLEVEVLRHLLMKLPSIYQPKTHAEMEAEHAAEEQKQAEIKAEKQESKPKAFRSQKPEKAPTALAPKAPKAAQPEETAAETAPKKAAPKKKDDDKKALEDIDAKLDSILSNPDLNF